MKMNGSSNFIRRGFMTPTQATHYLIFHTSILGVSGSGKTTLAKALFAELNYSALFMDTQSVGVPGETINSASTLRDMLKKHIKGKAIKAVLRPSVFDSGNSFVTKVLKTIEAIDRAQSVIRSRGGTRYFFIFIDEVQLLSRWKNVLTQLYDVALMGRNKNLFGVFISQRPQNIDKNLFTQSNLMIGRTEEFDREYYRSKYISFPNHEHSHEFFFVERMTGSRKERFVLHI